jgi:5-methylcytosine-specific restriction endonuclease McrA
LNKITYRPGCTPVQTLNNLKSALATIDRTEQCAVLWFAEIRRRRLFRLFGYSSMQQFAALELDFSRTRTGDYLQLAAKLDQLPKLRASLMDGKLGYTKARELIKVATPRNEEAWIQIAMSQSRTRLREKVRRVKHKAARRRAQPEPGETKGTKTHSPGADMSTEGDSPGANTPTTDSPPDGAPGANPPEDQALLEEVPVHMYVEFMPEQYARFEALTGRLQKHGHRTTGSGRAQVILDALEALVAEEEAGGSGTSTSASSSQESDSGERARRRAADESRTEDQSPLPGRAAAAENPPQQARVRQGPPVQIHVFHCPKCKGSTVRTSRGHIPISPSTFERLACDARIAQPGKPNKANVPGRVRALVLQRDGYRCQAPGCRHIHHLEIHHIVPRHKGGSNKADNLITLCSGCHRIWHEKGGPPPGWLPPGRKPGGTGP